MPCITLVTFTRARCGSGARRITGAVFPVSFVCTFPSAALQGAVGIRSPSPPEFWLGKPDCTATISKHTSGDLSASTDFK
ncbi:hypothetical protein TREES_T100020450 [Tupaia chinensis]|uniref:Uncharacterized protein n=1 Tax=Tupaia chinensis TaxID=246437 RepID=L9KVS4_TUPCH|nr:hypothetical protein TREES_T100020450 [Tupaia chinensis]